MERLSPQILLLKESKRGEQFHLTGANEQFSDWLNNDPYLEEEKASNNTVKRHVSSGITNKSSSLSYRRYSPCSNWTKSLKELNIKFEHFADSSCYIEQYRRAKQLRIEERFAKLMQLKERTVSCQNDSSFTDRNLQTTKQDGVYHSKKEQLSQHSVVKQCGNTVKPSLPQTGYFAGRKWVYPKDFARLYSKNIGVKCGRTELKRTEKQVQQNSTKMFLQGTGKPLNISSDKNWTVPRHRTACKSAPASRQNQSKHSQSGTWSTSHVKPMKSTVQSELLTPAGLSVVLQKHSISRPKSSLRNATVNHDYVKSLKKSVDVKSAEYENIFRSVFDFYEQNSDSRSHVYINT